MEALKAVPVFAACVRSGGEEVTEEAIAVAPS